MKSAALDYCVWGYSLKAQGNMSLNCGFTDGVLFNRKEFLSGLGINYSDLVCAKQVHGANVRWVEEVDKGKGALSYDCALDDTDGLITDKKDIPLAVLTADCLSVFLFDPKKPAVGLMHAGWRSSRANIVGKAVNLMRQKFLSQPQDILVEFGPSIGQCCYEVGVDFKGIFSYGLTKKDGRYYLDLAQVNRRQLEATGILPENIREEQRCTSCHNNSLFSFRREGNSCGRFMSVIMLK